MTGVPLVQPGVLEVVTDHVNSAWARKVGGILLGRPIDDVTRVDAALPARQTDEYAGEIAFPPPVWEEAYAKLDEHPGSTIVGWYHSHPGSGVAMSDYDRRLHKVLFGEPFSVALVLDPVADRMAWFGWDIGQVWPLLGEEPAPAATPVPVAVPGRGVRASVAALVALGILAGGAGGYWLDRELRPHPDRETVRQLRRRVQAESSQLGRLRGDLDRARRDLAAEQDRLRSAASDLEATRRALAEARRKLAEARQAETLRYRIRPGDTLWDLARTFLGDARKWPEIALANQSRITDPDHLLIGQVIDIPLGSGR
ncbi:MAG TPA: LysM peptidoglycan-binding domain-containing protein [Actinomycetota bacterium]